jgi:hypothetical protein
MNAFIEHQINETTRFMLDPDKVVCIVVQENQIMLQTHPFMFSFGAGSIYGTRDQGLEIVQKILDWRNAQFDRAEKLRNMLAEDPLSDPLPQPREGDAI